MFWNAYVCLCTGNSVFMVRGDLIYVLTLLVGR